MKLVVEALEDVLKPRSQEEIKRYLIDKYVGKYFIEKMAKDPYLYYAPEIEWVSDEQQYYLAFENVMRSGDNDEYYLVNPQEMSHYIEVNIDDFIQEKEFEIEKLQDEIDLLKKFKKNA